MHIASHLRDSDTEDEEAQGIDEEYGVLKRYILKCYLHHEFVMQEWQK